MDDLIVPGRSQKPVRVLEHTAGLAAAIDVPELGTVHVETPTEKLLLERGNWMILPAEMWHAILRDRLVDTAKVREAEALIAASTRAGRRARKIVAQHKRDARN